jgi:hypothetical protein
MGGRAQVVSDVVWAYARSLPEGRHIDIDATNRYRALIRLTPAPRAVLVFAVWVRNIVNLRTETA